MIALFRLGIAVFAAMAAAVPVAAQDIAGDWIDGERHRVRIFAGAVPDAAPGTVTAFIEMAMDRGWKTYLEKPGYGGRDSAGVQIRCVEECGEGGGALSGADGDER